MMSVAFKEGLKIQPNALDELISASQNDIRQVDSVVNILYASVLCTRCCCMERDSLCVRCSR